jgi:hypothetical protein
MAVLVGGWIEGCLRSVDLRGVSQGEAAGGESLKNFILTKNDRCAMTRKPHVGRG